MGIVLNGIYITTLAEILATFCPCPETLGEALLKDDRLVYLVEENSKQHCIQAVVYVLLATFSQI